MKEVNKYLMQEEKIVWQGAPEPSVLFSKGDVFLIPFSLLWGGFALYAFAQVLLSGEGLFGPGIFVLPAFALIGIYMIIGRFIFKVIRKKRTTYVITDKRILIISSLFGETVELTYINTISVINKIIRKDGIGTLIFGTGNPMSANYANTGMEFLGNYYGSAPPSFYDIKDAESVFNTVNSLRNT